MDHGHDFYAPQSFATRWPADRSAGWIWESPLPAAGRLGGHALLPRELSLSADNRLQMRPAKEVESLRGAWFPGR
jgi:beta-fructofuranosidase